MVNGLVYVQSDTGNLWSIPYIPINYASDVFEVVAAYDKNQPMD